MTGEAAPADDGGNAVDPVHREWPTWERLGRRTVYASWWMELHLDQVRRNDGSVIEHEVVVSPRGASGVVVAHPERGVLLIYRHRFIPDSWGWELPAGVIDPGETPETAARRECEEESGYRPGALRHLTSWHPSSGFSDQTFHVFLAESAEGDGHPSDPNEASFVAWRSYAEVASDLISGRIPDGFTQVGLLWAFALTGRAHLLSTVSGEPLPDSV